jgi:hypothetical protein
MVVLVFGWMGSVLCVPIFLVTGLVISLPSATSGAEIGHAFGGALMASPFLLFIVPFWSFWPALATGGLLAIEYWFRGRVSWLAAGVAPLVVFAFGKPFTDAYFGPVIFLTAVLTGLAVRALYRRILGGGEVFAKSGNPGRVIGAYVVGGVPGVLGVKATEKLRSSRRWRLKIVLTYLGCVPPIAALLTTISLAPHALWLLPFRILVVYVMFGVQALVAGLILAWLADPERGVPLVHSIWATLPVSLLIAWDAGDKHLVGALTLMISAAVATIVVTMLAGSRLRPKLPEEHSAMS